MLSWHNSHAVLCRQDSWYFTCKEHDPMSRNPLERQFSCRTAQNTNVLTLKGYPGILDGRLCCLAGLEKSEAQTRVSHAPNECWLFNITSYQSRMRSAEGLLDKCARFHLSVYVHSQISRTSNSINLQVFYVAPRYSEIIRVLLAILRRRVVSPHVVLKKMWLHITARNVHLHTQTHTANPTTAIMAKLIGAMVT